MTPSSDVGADTPMVPGSIPGPATNKIKGVRPNAVAPSL